MMTAMCYVIEATSGKIAGMIAGTGPDWVPAGHQDGCYFDSKEEAEKYMRDYTWEDGLRIRCVAK